MLQGPGENAGAVDIGDGLAAVFKIESHNHPSFIEPYQGAATGVGGIIRDIFTMGARPIALMNSLRFGPLDGPDGARNRRIVEGVVAGIAGYGNSIGIPTVGGEIAFDDSYAGNPLVNVFCLGIAKADALVLGKASGVGNPVFYVGAKTGRDGIHGATMASAEFDEKSAEKRPAVQVGDPFMEKLLLEACLELMQTDALVGVQDMGAAGLDLLDLRDGRARRQRHRDRRQPRAAARNRHDAYEIMLSESQERMLLVVKKGREAEVEAIFEKWDLHASHIGDVMNDGILRVKNHGEVVAEIPERPARRRSAGLQPPDRAARLSRRANQLDQATLARLAGGAAPPRRGMPSSRCSASPTVASKRWVYRQYDHMVRTNSIVLAGMGAGVVRIKGTSARARDVDRRQRPLLLPQSAPRRHARARRSGAQRRLRRRAADRRHQLPELRQSRAPRDHVAARRGDRRPGRRLPGPRHSDHRRQRQPLQRDRRPGDLSDAHHRRRRVDRGRDARRVANLQAAPATRSSSSARVTASSEAASI